MGEKLVEFVERFASVDIVKWIWISSQELAQRMRGLKHVYTLNNPGTYNVGLETNYKQFQNQLQRISPYDLRHTMIDYW